MSLQAKRQRYVLAGISYLLRTASYGYSGENMEEDYA
jgi:hypothetical protein